jgi:large subunit ribosomal protein L15
LAIMPRTAGVSKGAREAVEKAGGSIELIERKVPAELAAAKKGTAQAARKERTRVGRGIGSGKGKTGGRGQKGQKSRSGVAIKGFEGGQMPLHMRLPKRGFNNVFAKDYAEVNLGMVQKFIDAKKLDAKGVIDHEALKAAGLARGGKDGVRLLGKGELTAKVSFKVAGASKGAVAAVEKAGGKVEVIAAPTPEAEKKAARRDANAAAKAK